MNKFRPKSGVLIFVSAVLFAFHVTPAQVTNRAVLDTTGDGRTDLHLIAKADPGSGSRTYWCSRPITNQTVLIGCTNLGLPPAGGFEQLIGADFENDSDTEKVFVRPAPGFPGVTQLQAFGSFPFQQGPIVFGLETDDHTVIGDYSGDGKADAVVFRCNPADPVGTQCYWIYRLSEIGLYRWVPWGTVYAPGLADIAAPGDYDGDGRHDYAIRRLTNPSDPNSQVIFYILRSTDGGYEIRHFGLGLDRFVKGDFDGDGKADLCAVRNTRVAGAQLQWFIRYSGGGEVSFLAFGLGKQGPIGDYLAPGDYTGDGRTDIAIWRRPPVDDRSFFYILSSSPTPGAFGPVLYEQVQECMIGACERPVAEYLVH